MSWTGKNMYIPEIVMLCGIPCSGKSTYVNKLLTYEYWENSIILSTDNYIEEQAKRLGMTYNEVFQDCIDEATRQLEMSFVRAKEEGKRIIWDQTNLSIKTRKKKLTKVPSIYKRTVVWFQVDLEEALKRNGTREGKFIPESILKRMYHQFEVPTLEEGFDFVSCGNDET